MTDKPNDELRESIKHIFKASSAVSNAFHFSPTMFDACLDRAMQLIKAQQEQAVFEVRKKERANARKLYARRNPTYTRTWIADTLGVSRPTLNKWIENPELFTIGAVIKLAQLQAKRGEGDVPPAV